jgi:hypothetical protein
LMPIDVLHDVDRWLSVLWFASPAWAQRTHPRARLHELNRCWYGAGGGSSREEEGPFRECL